MAKKFISDILASLSAFLAIPLMKELLIFMLSMSPILELRGGLIAASVLHMDPVKSYFICVLGNILPIPIILLLFDRVISWMRKGKRLNKIAKKVDKKVEKNRPKIEKYGYLGLILFVAIPLPGTGAWTACLVASALKLGRKKSSLYIAIGTAIAGLITVFVTFGILARYV